MCRHCSWVDQEPYAGLPSYRAPQPELEASVMTTILLEVIPNCTPDWNRRGVVQGATALRQQWVRGPRHGMHGMQTGASSLVLWFLEVQQEVLFLLMTKEENWQLPPEGGELAFANVFFFINDSSPHERGELTFMSVFYWWQLTARRGWTDMCERRERRNALYSIWVRYHSGG